MSSVVGGCDAAELRPPLVGGKPESWASGISNTPLQTHLSVQRRCDTPRLPAPLEVVRHEASYQPSSKTPVDVGQQ